VTLTVLFGLFGLPLFLLVSRRAFDIGRPWGIVALGLTIPTFGEWFVGRTLVNIIEMPILLFGLSWLVGILALMVPTRPDNFGNTTRAIDATDETSAVAPIG